MRVNSRINPGGRKDKRYTRPSASSPAPILLAPLIMDWHIAYVGLGSNIGDRKFFLVQAIDQVIRTPGVRLVGLSSIYETDPVGMPEGTAPFYNAVLALQVTLSPETLHEVLRAAERKLGRESHHPPNADRTIDLDLLLYDDVVQATPELTLPHPRLHERAFVLAPLVELLPELVHPTLNRTVESLLSGLPQKGISRVS